jgi:hypothetical protein
LDLLANYGYSKKIKLQYITKLTNIDSNKQGLLLEYENIQFLKINKDSYFEPISEKIYNAINDINNDFFKNDAVIAISEIEVNDFIIGARLFEKNLSNAINAIYTVLNKLYNHIISEHPYPIIYTDILIVDPNKQIALSWNQKYKSQAKLDTDFFKRLSQSNLNLDSAINQRLIEILAISDKIYWQACVARDVVDKVNYFWQYLESCFQYYNGKNKVEEIMKIISSILLIGEENQYLTILKDKIRHRIIKTGLHDTISGNNKSLSNFGRCEMMFFKDLFKNQPHLKFLYCLINKYLNYNKNQDLDKVKKYYTSILLETYAQRNFIVHSSKPDENAILKISDILGNIVGRFRDLLTEKAKTADKSYNNLEEVIKELSIEGNNLLKTTKADLQAFTNKYREVLNEILSRNFCLNATYYIQNNYACVLHISVVESENQKNEIETEDINLKNLKQKSGFTDSEWQEKLEAGTLKLFDPKDIYMIKPSSLAYWSEEKARLDAKELLDNLVQKLPLHKQNA